MTEHDERSQRLDERLSRLPAEIPPDRDLWPEIAARLETGDGRSGRPVRTLAWRPMVAAAATVVVAVLVVSLYRGGEAPSPGVAPPGAPVPMASTFGPGHELGSGYLAARAGLTEDLERSLAALSPETRAIVLENLETIRRSAAEINTALGKDPANVLLQQQLLAAYQDELSVLANLQRVTERLPTRNEI
jgi:hypothetical protein